MDDETAEIELLEQNLNKTRQISKRITSILDSFDTRIAKLEKSILPLYTAAQILNRRSHNIDQALFKIDEMATTQEDLAAEEALILRGPQSNNVQGYREALARLNASIAFKSADRDLAETARLVETGAKKLTQLYTTIVAEGSSGVTPTTPGTALVSTSFPSSLLSNLSPLVSFLRNLPLPATHPSHPAAPAIMATLKDAQKGYADMRGNWSVKCLEGQGKRLVTRADTVDAITTGTEFGQWVETLLAVTEDEYKLLKELSPLTSPVLIASAYGILLNPILKLFGTVLGQMLTLIKKSLQKYNFLALSAYDALLQQQPAWEEVLARRGSEYLDDKNELRDGLQSLRQVCLRSFPEFLVDLKLGANNRDSDTSVKVVELTIDTVKYIERIPQVQAAVSSALLALGDGNWKMGEGVQVGKSSKGGDVDETVILEHFLYDAVTNAINSINIISRTRRPAFGSIFLLNNISYLRYHLLVSPTHTSLPALLSTPAIDALNSNWRTAKAGYFDTNFTPLMQAITDEHGGKEKSGPLGGSSSKAQAKEKFTRFYDLLEEVVERHRMARVLEEDVEGRRAVREEIVMLVVPSLKRFMQKQKEKEFSRNPQKYIKQSPDDVEAQLRSLYN
ncbi:exocyst complex component, exo70 subunit [Macrolepiota fuliginosa MF-IS2]|uniref:Exocyst complex protein EXO70 n=1 Tax=Macrolepiota fuliginosa MF-IS2 TaxID=1400762 RepID=A0A9P6BZ79_9AGAR|nr:exocyst complex component, exo70 subunit [Macrolepiota fuliginosa MF-IS2]